MKNWIMIRMLAGIFFLGAIGHGNAQFLKKLGKKAEEAAARGVEQTVERKVQQKAEDKTDQAIDAIFGVPSKVKQKSDPEPEETIVLEGTWYYESLEGLPGYETLNECNRKSNITYSGTTYHTQFYDEECNLLTDSGGTYELEGTTMTVVGETRDEVSRTKVTSTQTILEYSSEKLVIRDAMSGAVVTLKKGN